MKLQATLTFGLAVALLGGTGRLAAAPPVAAAYPSAPVAAYGTPAYGTPAAAIPQAAAPQPVAAATPSTPTYGYPTQPQPQPTYGYPTAPPAAYAAAPVAAGYPGPSAPQYQAPPVTGYAAAPLTGQPVHVAQAPSGSSTRGESIAPATVATPPAAAPHPHAPHAADSWSGYIAPTAPAGPGCETGDCGTGAVAYQSTGDTGCASGACGVDLGAYSAGPSRQWFFGLYGLLLERDNPGKANVAVQVDTPPTGVYYPQPGIDTFITTGDVNPDFRGGAEIRFGSTLGNAIDPCTGACYQPFAWELAYWGITDDPEQVVLIDDLGTGDADRIYGQRNYAGLEHNREGNGYRPLNDYVDYQVPVDPASTNDIRVLAVRVRQNFEADNIELNFWRFGSPGAGAGGSVGCAGGSCGLGGGCADGACGSSCGYDTCGCQGCAPQQRFFISGLAGFRYFRTDESLQTATSFTNTSIGTDPTVYPGGFPIDDPRVIFDDIEVDNELVGFQLGCSLNHLIGCRWTLFCDSNFGVYANDIEKYQRIFAADSQTRFVTGQQDAVIRSSKQDVAFLSEARCGVAYQLGCRTRLTAAWRVIAVSGVALAVEQVPTEFASIEQAAHIDSNDSVVIHGLQAGIEMKY